MASVIEEFIDDISILPPEIQRRMQLIRTLDEGSWGLLEDIKQSQNAYMDTLKHEGKNDTVLNDPRKVNPEHWETLEAQRIEATQRSDEKVHVAEQCLGLIDTYLKKLDSQMDTLKEQLVQTNAWEEPEDEEAWSRDGSEAETPNTGAMGRQYSADSVAMHSLPSATPAHARLGGAMNGAQMMGMPQAAPSPALSYATPRHGGVTPLGGAPAAGMAQVPHPGGVMAQHATRQSANAGVAAAAATQGVHIQEPEEVYCVCQRPSMGNMIGCDNDNCPYEWFHLPCVDLQEPPPAEAPWYCPECYKTLAAKRDPRIAGMHTGLGRFRKVSDEALVVWAKKTEHIGFVA